MNTNSFGQTNFINFNVGDVVTSKINNVEILKSPDDSSEVLYKVTKEDELIYLGENANSFSKIKFNNKNGWIDTSFLTSKKIISSGSNKNIGKNLLTKCEGENYFKWSNCVGSFTYLDGPRKGYTYQGEVLDGKANGSGKRIGPKTEYEGNFEKGEMTGVGKFTSHKGEKYSGGFLDGKYDGEGSVILPNGDRYIGPFKNGKYHGIGSYISSNPFFTPSTGRWVNNEFID